MLLAAAAIAAVDTDIALGPGSAVALSGPSVAVGLATVVVITLMVQWARAGTPRPASSDRRLTNLGRLVLHLWPVIVLTTLYPLVSPRMEGHEVSGVPLTTFILMVAVTVPWISQAVCAPLYRVLQPIWEDGGRVELQRGFWRYWPATFLVTLPLSGAFAVVLWFGLGWSRGAVGSYLALLVLNVVFSQVLVVTNISKSRSGWAAGWTAYSLPVVLIPTAWILPPVCGIAVLAVSWTRVRFERPHALALRPAVSDMVAGLLLGSVLWADKFLYFLHGDNDIEILTLFISLLPAVVAYNYYFVCLEPAMGEVTRGVRSTLEGAPMRWLPYECTSMGRFVSWSLASTALLGAAIALVLALVAGGTGMDQVQVAVVSMASWLMMMCTITCYKIDYAGARRAPLGLSAAYLVACVVAFGLAPTGVQAYVWLGVAASGVLVAALVQCTRLWRRPQYSLFWKHAVRW
ncbi:MAG TPA: hypothetical protein VIY72_03085 [Acidimicrobiales bacterium]